MKRVSLQIAFSITFLFSFQFVHGQAWEWAKSGYGNIDDYGQSVVTDAVGNVYVCGTFNSSTFTYGAGSLINPGCSFIGEACDVVYLLKCDPYGNPIWIKSPTGSGGAISVTIDNNGNILVAGTFYSAAITFGTTTLINDSNNTADVFLVKYDTSGNVIWARSAGGKKDDIATAVKSDQIGNAYISGYFISPTITFGTTTLTNDSPGIADIFIVKYDANGNVKWAKRSGGKEDDEANYLATDAQCNVYVTGYFNSPSIIFGHDTLMNGGGYQNMFVVKYDSSGNFIWANDPGSNDNINPASISTDLYGSVYITGYYWGFTAAFGPFTFTNPDTISSGDTYNLFLLKYDSAGNIKWARTAIGDNYSQAVSVTNDVAGNVYIAGQTISDNLAFGTDTLPSDIFLVKYDSTGNVMWAANARGNIGDDFPNCITTDNSGNVYMTGTFASWVMNFGATTLRDTNNLYMFLAKYSGAANTSTGLIKQQNQDIVVYPNPAITQLTVQATNQLISQIIIINLLGQVVCDQSCNAEKVVINIAGLATGVYIVKINGSEVRKLVKQ